MIKTIYVSRVGKNYRLSEHFTLGEFQCKDGTDAVKYSPALFSKLEELRAYGGFTISITSGYRTSAYNKKIGGASASQHIKGTAADIVVYKDGKVVNARKICCICQSLGFKGIGFISDTATHVDMRTFGSYRGDERKGYKGNVGNDFYRYFGITAESIKALKKEALKPPQKQQEDEMTQAEFNRMMDAYMAERSAKKVSPWAEKAWAWGKAEGITDGTAPGGYATREQIMTFLYRFIQIIRG